MQKYGIIENGELKIKRKTFPEAKPVEYSEIPEFNQENQAVFEGEITEESERILVGVNIVDIEPDEESADE